MVFEAQEHLSPGPFLLPDTEFTFGGTGMVTTNEAPQEVVVADQTGETQSDQNTDDQPGVSAKTFTQSEVDAQVVQSGSAKDQEIAGLRRDKAEAVLNEEILSAREQEATRITKDQQQVDVGTITADEARRRSEQRQTEVVATIKEKHSRAAATEAFNEELSIAQNLVRWNRANTLGREHSLSPEQIEILEKDTAIKTEDHMTVRAERMALDKAQAEMKGTETFDIGQTGGSGPRLDGLSPNQLTQLAYSDSEVQRRKRSRRS